MVPSPVHRGSGIEDADERAWSSREPSPLRPGLLRTLLNVQRDGFNDHEITVLWKFELLLAGAAHVKRHDDPKHDHQDDCNHHWGECSPTLPLRCQDHPLLSLTSDALEL